MLAAANWDSGAVDGDVDGDNGANLVLEDSGTRPAIDANYQQNYWCWLTLLKMTM